MKKEKTLFKKIKTQVRGITLIALVITIIILLILAGVAINLSIGTNGIFTRAENAVDKYKEASVNEQKETNQITDFLDKYIRKVEGVTIPKGFYYVGGTKKDGIVISDNEADENKYKEQTEEGNSQIPGDGLIGNQFVWVPVESIDDFIRYKSYYNGSTIQIINYHEPSQEGYRYPNELEEYNSMMQSVEENKGFYVARYEAGKENINGTDTVVSKKGAMVWNGIAWGESIMEIGTDGAVGMYTDKNSYAVTSTLIYGVQWDAIMSWIDPSYKTSSCKEDSIIVDSTGKGNYLGSAANCGSNDLYRVNNIYDLAGNVSEWTMEACLTNKRVRRGGNYNDDAYVRPVSTRGGAEPEVGDIARKRRSPWFSSSFILINI